MCLLSLVLNECISGYFPTCSCYTKQTLPFIVQTVTVWDAFHNMQTTFHVSALRGLSVPIPQANCSHNTPLYHFYCRVYPMLVQFFVLCR